MVMAAVVVMEADPLMVHKYLRSDGDRSDVLRVMLKVVT